MNFFHKIISFFKDVKIIIVAENEDSSSAEILFNILKERFRARKFSGKLPGFLDLLMGDYFIIKNSFLSPKFATEIASFIKISSTPILAVIGNTKKDDSHFQEKQAENIKLIAKEIPPQGFFIFNSDDKIFSSVKRAVGAKSFSFGFRETADFRASDVTESAEEINFKLNYKGNIVPFWLNKDFGKEVIYDFLLSICAGSVLGLNVVEISEFLKNYR